MDRTGDKASSAPSQANDFFVRAPAVALPKGGGAIRGIGEKFGANPVTGTGSMTVPIATSPGRSGFGPQLALSYDSGAGNGPFGMGWNVGLPAITRKTDKGLPLYRDTEDSDEFILSGAEDLVPVFKTDPTGAWIRDARGNQIIDDFDRIVDATACFECCDPYHFSGSCSTCPIQSSGSVTLAMSSRSRTYCPTDPWS